MRFAAEDDLGARAPRTLSSLGDAVWDAASAANLQGTRPASPDSTPAAPPAPALDQGLQRRHVNVLGDQRAQPIQMALADHREGLRHPASTAAAPRRDPRQQPAAHQVALEQPVPGGAEHRTDGAALALAAAVVESASPPWRAGWP